MTFNKFLAVPTASLLDGIFCKSARNRRWEIALLKEGDLVERFLFAQLRRPWVQLVKVVCVSTQPQGQNSSKSLWLCRSLKVPLLRCCLCESFSCSQDKIPDTAAQWRRGLFWLTVSVGSGLRGRNGTVTAWWKKAAHYLVARRQRAGRRKGWTCTLQ